MGNYYAEVINLSLKDKKMIKRFPVRHVKKRFLGLVKIYTISIPANDIEATVSAFQGNLGRSLNKEWYIAFHTAEDVIVTFREKIFTLSGKGIAPVSQKCLDITCAEDWRKWDEMIAYAKSLGIPDDQCDFLPEDFNKQDYCEFPV